MRSLVLEILLLTASTCVMATQMVTATPSRTQLYLEVPFTIDLTITPPEAVGALEVVATSPSGFQISAPKNPMPNALGAGSSYTAVYEITPPREAHATTEHYRVVFNVKYRHATPSLGETDMWQSVEVPFNVTFSRDKFYFWGMAGLILGWSIKALSIYSGSESPASTTEAKARGFQALVAFLSRREVTSALTSLATGFLALLLLSRTELPTGAIHDTLALGIGLGFLSDDQLLNRIKGLRGS